MDIDSGNVLEKAVRFKEKSDHDVEILALSMGNEDCEDVLIQALAIGADEAVHIKDNAFEGADTLMTAKVLSSILIRYGLPDIILAGNNSQDGRTGNTGPMLAEVLNITDIPGVTEFEINENSVDTLMIKSKEDELIKTIKTSMPTVLIGAKQQNILRNVSIFDLTDAMEKDIKIYSASDLDLSKDDLTPKLKVWKVLSKHSKRKKIIIEYDDSEDTISLLTMIKKDYNSLV